MQNHPTWQKELQMLASIIARFPFEKTTKWGSDVFVYNGKNVISYGGFKNYFTLWFYNGVFINDTYNVLVNAQEGKTKSLRQWRFTSAEEIDEEKISAYIQEAIEIEKKGLKLRPEKFQPIPVPEILALALENDINMKDGYAKLTPGKQKEYVVYLNEAKQEQTKLNRLEKIKPLIKQGIGLNEKYK